MPIQWTPCYVSSRDSLALKYSLHCWFVCTAGGEEGEADPGAHRPGLPGLAVLPGLRRGTPGVVRQQLPRLPGEQDEGRLLQTRLRRYVTVRFRSH